MCKQSVVNQQIEEFSVMQFISTKEFLFLTQDVGWFSENTILTTDGERKINKAMESKYLIYLFTHEKSVVYYFNSINSNGGLIETIKNNSVKLGFTTGENEVLDDLIIENNQCYRQAEIHSTILASVLGARASIVGNNLNALMKALNFITISMMVPTLVVSIFTKNVPISGQQHHHLFWIIRNIAIASVGFMMIAKKKEMVK